jgi:hypothetical protein
MKIKQTILALALIIGFGSVLISLSPIASADCDGAKTSIINCDKNSTGGGVTNTGIWVILLTAINILTAGIGVAAVAGIVYGAIMYASAGGGASSGGGANQVKKAKTILLNVVIGLVAYALMYAFLNFVIPGGLFT